MRKYDPTPLHRKVRKVETTIGGQVIHQTYSLTRTGTNIKHHPVVDVETGCVHCDCEHFTYRVSKAARDANALPSVTTPQYQCKHIQRAIAGCIRRGELQPVQPEPAPIPEAPERRDPFAGMTPEEKMAFIASDCYL